jgi:hypothetical protein
MLQAHGRGRCSAWAASSCCPSTTPCGGWGCAPPDQRRALRRLRRRRLRQGLAAGWASCDATLGPGATNLVTGLVEALNAGSPLVAIVGDTHRAHSWKNMTQEARQAEILRPACKELLRVERTERIPELVRRAFAVATRPPGPVVLIVPEDVCHGTHGFAPRLRRRPALSGGARAALPPRRRGCRARRGAAGARPSAR